LPGLVACGATPEEATTADRQAGEAESAGRAPVNRTAPVPAAPDECGPDEAGAMPCPTTPDPHDAEARDLFEDGVRMYEQGDYNGALLKFRAAYELSPRGALLYNIARCQEQLGDLQGALRSFQHYLHASEGQLPENDRRMVLEKIRQLERQLGLR
jgi:tetratricopeptide (TPR) repeat protein